MLDYPGILSERSNLTKHAAFERRWVSFAKKPSTALSHEAEVGV
jgi:hypothetical protein